MNHNKHATNQERLTRTVRVIGDAVFAKAVTTFDDLNDRPHDLLTDPASKDHATLNTLTPASHTNTSHKQKR